MFTGHFFPIVVRNQFGTLAQHGLGVHGEQPFEVGLDVAHALPSRGERGA